MRRTGQVVAIAIAAVLLVGTAAGVAFLDLVEPAEDVEPRSPEEIARWCDDVAAGVGPDRPFPDVAALVEAIEAGELTTPDDDPPQGSPEAVGAWQDANAAYLTSSYLRQLPTDGAPDGLMLSWAVLQLAIENAHEGRPGYHAGELDGVADSLDGYLERRC